MATPVGLLATALLVGAVAVQSASSDANANRFGSCPRGTLPLSRADLPTARRVVLRFATHEFVRRAPDMDPTGATAGRAVLGPDWAKNGFIKAKCGRQVWRRTAVVGVTYPAMFYSDPTAPGPCNSCAGVELLASRTRAGWVVWYAL